MNTEQAIKDELRHENQLEAYEWAKKNPYQSVAARYAHILACMVDEERAINAKLQADLDTVVQNFHKDCSECAALREKAERENPKPLTLEQLRERVGEPVWIQKEHYGEYKVFKKYHDSLNKYGKRYWFTDKEILFECNYGETWLAYDHEPKEAR